MSRKTTRNIIIVLSILIAMMVIAIAFLYIQSTRLPERQPYETVEETPDVIEKIDVRRITIHIEDREIHRGTRFFPEVIIHPEDATDKSFILQSDNERVIRQQGQNWVAVSIGTANLIATAPNGVTGTIRITVLAPDLEDIAFEKEEIVMEPGDTIFLNPELIPKEAFLPDPIVFTSSNENVVIVARDGRTTAVGSGTATVRAVVGDIRAEVKISVEVPVRSISVVLNRREFNIGDRVEFQLKIEPENATNAQVDVSFTGAAVTQTGDNRFTCDEAGEVTITFTTKNDRSASVTIVVYDLAAFAEEVRRLTNLERTGAGLTQFGSNPALTRTAELRAVEIITRMEADHRRPDGSEFYTAFDELGVVYTTAAENLAAGQRSPAEVVRAWMESPGHRRNVLNDALGQMGVGVTMDSDGRIYWTQTFTD